MLRLQCIQCSLRLSTSVLSSFKLPLKAVFLIVGNIDLALLLADLRTPGLQFALLGFDLPCEHLSLVCK